MPAPTTYTEAQLAAYVVTALGETASALGWVTAPTVTPALQEAVNDTLLLYGVNDIANATDPGKLRAFARVAAWRAALASLAARFAFSTDQQEFKRSEMFRMAQANLAQAEADATPFGLVGQAAVVGKVEWADDPYAAEVPETVEV